MKTKRPIVYPTLESCAKKYHIRAIGGILIYPRAFTDFWIGRQVAKGDLVIKQLAAIPRDNQFWVGYESHEL